MNPINILNKIKEEFDKDYNSGYKKLEEYIKKYDYSIPNDYLGYKIIPYRIEDIISNYYACEIYSVDTYEHLDKKGLSIYLMIYSEDDYGTEYPASVDIHLDKSGDLSFTHSLSHSFAYGMEEIEKDLKEYIYSIPNLVEERKIKLQKIN